MAALGTAAATPINFTVAITDDGVVGTIGANAFFAEGGKELRNDVAGYLSPSVKRIIDPYGRLADVDNDEGRAMSKQTYDTILLMEAEFAGLIQLNNICCKQ